MNSRRLDPSRVLIGSLVLVPFLGALSFILLLGVDVPYFDQWQFAQVVVLPLFRGELSFEHLHAQHNAHRLFFPKIWLAGLAWLSDWNTHIERLSILAFVLLTYFGAASLFRRAGSRPALLVAVATLFASLHQWENWLWGWQVQIPMCLAASTWCLVFLAKYSDLLRGFLVPALLAYLATFSFGIGVLLWPIAFALVVQRERGRRLAGVLWTLCAAIAAFLYLDGLEAEPSVAAEPASVLDFGLGLASLFGAPLLASDSRAQTMLGIGALACFAILAIWAWRNRRTRRDALALASLGVFACLSGLAIGWGRLRFGWHGVMPSRYVTITSLLWVALLALAHLWAGANVARPAGFRKRGVGIMSVVVVGILLLTQHRGLTAGIAHRDFTLDMRERFVTGQGVTAEWLRAPINPGVSSFRLIRDFLLQRRLSLFRDPDLASRAAPTVGPRLSLAVEARPDRLVFSMSEGKSESPTWLFLVVPRAAPVPVHFAQLDARGRLRCALPRPSDFSGKLEFLAVSLVDKSLLVSDLVDVDLTTR